MAVHQVEEVQEEDRAVGKQYILLRPNDQPCARLLHERVGECDLSERAGRERHEFSALKTVLRELIRVDPRPGELEIPLILLHLPVRGDVDVLVAGVVREQVQEVGLSRYLVVVDRVVDHPEELVEYVAIAVTAVVVGLLRAALEDQHRHRRHFPAASRTSCILSWIT